MTGFDSWQGKIFIFSEVSRLNMEPTQPPLQWVPGNLYPGVRQKGYEAECSPPSTDKVKNSGVTRISSLLGKLSS
jgi:hypothetical protein